jgi:hypothetical protein
MNSKAIDAAIIFFCCVFSCTNPQDDPNDYVFSENEKNDIVRLAAGIKNSPIDSLAIRNMHPSHDFVGIVHYTPEFIDTDKVVFGELMFCNSAWPRYSIFNRIDGELTIVNGWASSRLFLRLDTATVVKYESCSLYIGNSDHPSKDTVTYFVDKINKKEFLPYRASYVFSDPICAINGFSCSQSNDSLYVSVTCSTVFRSVSYQFVEVNRVLILLSVCSTVA